MGMRQHQYMADFMSYSGMGSSKLSWYWKATQDL